MKIILKFLLVLYVALPITLNALEVGKWSFEKADEYCYIGSLATETDLPSDKKRGDFYVLVYKNIYKHFLIKFLSQFQAIKF